MLAEEGRGSGESVSKQSSLYVWLVENLKALWARLNRALGHMWPPGLGFAHFCPGLWW